MTGTNTPGRNGCFGAALLLLVLVIPAVLFVMAIGVGGWFVFHQMRDTGSSSPRTVAVQETLRVTEAADGLVVERTVVPQGQWPGSTVRLSLDTPTYGAVEPAARESEYDTVEPEDAARITDLTVNGRPVSGAASGSVGEPVTVEPTQPLQVHYLIPARAGVKGAAITGGMVQDTTWGSMSVTYPPGARCQVLGQEFSSGAFASTTCASNPQRLRVHQPQPIPGGGQDRGSQEQAWIVLP